jgi:hypothetical protein
MLKQMLRALLSIVWVPQAQISRQTLPAAARMRAARARTGSTSASTEIALPAASALEGAASSGEQETATRTMTSSATKAGGVSLMGTFDGMQRESVAAYRFCSM